MDAGIIILGFRFFGLIALAIHSSEYRVLAIIGAIALFLIINPTTRYYALGLIASLIIGSLVVAPFLLGIMHDKVSLTTCQVVGVVIAFIAYLLLHGLI